MLHIPIFQFSLVDDSPVSSCQNPESAYIVKTATRFCQDFASESTEKNTCSFMTHTYDCCCNNAKTSKISLEPVFNWFLSAYIIRLVRTLSRRDETRFKLLNRVLRS